MKEDWALKIAIELLNQLGEEPTRELLAALIALNLKQQRQIGYLEGCTKIKEKDSE